MVNSETFYPRDYFVVKSLSIIYYSNEVLSSQEWCVYLRTIPIMRCLSRCVFPQRANYCKILLKKYEHDGGDTGKIMKDVKLMLTYADARISSRISWIISAVEKIEVISPNRYDIVLSRDTIFLTVTNSRNTLNFNFRILLRSFFNNQYSYLRIYITDMLGKLCKLFKRTK